MSRSNQTSDDESGAEAAKRPTLSASELEAQYAVTDEEARLVRLATNGESPRLTFLTMLKTRRHLGYFLALPEVPDQIVRFLGDVFG